MNNPADLKYSKDHEWAKVEGNVVTMGVTDHAQHSMGDVVFVELPEEGDTVTAGKSYGTIESVKAVSDIIASVSGKVVEANQDVVDAPDMVNNDPYGDGWLVKVEADDLKALDGMMSAAEYEAYLAEEEQ